MTSNTKKIAVLGVFSAFAFVALLAARIPVVLFLKYEPKDVIIAIAGFVFGPMSAFIVSVIVSLIEMLTISDTGWIGMIMNIVSTCSFVCTASVIYKRHRSIKGALIGLIAGVLLMTAVMILWNFFLTPVYMKIPRRAVAEMLIPTFLPFNLLKGFLNAGLVMLIYKPLSNSLKKMNLLPVHETAEAPTRATRAGVVILSAFVVITGALLILAWKGII